MLSLLQVDSTLVAQTAQQTSEAAKALIHGDTSAINTLLQQLVTLAVEAGKSILVAVLVYIVGRFIVRLLNNFLARVLERRKIDTGIQTFLKSFVNILLTLLLVISVIGALGINTTSFAALLASLGMAFGMALSGNLQNFAGGVVVLLLKPFRVGDVIEAQGVSGVVKEIQIFHTIITTGDNKVIYLPNGALSSGNIVNYNNELRRVDLTIGVEYDTKAEDVKKALLEILNTDPDVIHDDESHPPFVALANLGASSVDYTVRMWVKGSDYWKVFFRVQETIYTELNRQGINFPYPQMTIHQAK